MNPSAHSVALSTLVEKMWPTPRAANPGSRPKGNGGKILEEEVLIAEGLRERGRVLGATMWPTPTVQDAKNNGGPSQWKRNSDPLNVAVQRWPTPRVSMANGPSQAEIDAGNPRGRLETAVAISEMMPTPTANRWDGLQSHGVNVVSGKLNPTWVEWLMGFPLGWTDLDASGTL